MKTSNMKNSLVIATVAVLVSGGSATLAQDAGRDADELVTKATAVSTGREYRAESVQYDDLNLSNQAGVSTLYQRIDVAAKTVCQPQPDIRDMLMTKDWESCYARALDRAVGSAQLPALSRYHLVKTGRIDSQDTLVTKAH